MPARYVIDPHNRIVLTVFYGVLTYKEAAEQVGRLGNDPTFDPSFSELIDFNGVSEVRLNDGDFKTLLEIAPFSTSAKHAFVVSAPNSVYGVVRMYQTMLGEQTSVQVFATVTEAMRWLTSPANTST